MIVGGVPGRPTKERKESMKRVTGIGGIFFKSEDPDKLYQWHQTHLGIRRSLTARARSSHGARLMIR